MKILDITCIDVNKDIDTEYTPIITDDDGYRVRVTRHNIGMEFIVSCDTDEYYWMFGDHCSEKLTKSFELALCEFIKEECFEDDEAD